MAGLVAAFIFAVQMLNFPIFTAGVSGHLLGGALAAMLVGPWVGALCVSVVLIVQALVFADGGVTALGLNITNMALLGTAAAYLLIALLLRVLPRTPAGLGVDRVRRRAGQRGGRVAGLRRCSTGSAAPPTSAATWPASPARWPASHLLIGIGEGLITATTVVTVAKVRPDLVYALRGLRPRGRAARRRPSEVSGDEAILGFPGRRPAGRPAARRRGQQLRLVAPGRARLDRCSRAARSTPTARSPAAPASAQQAKDHELADSPLADYGVRGVGQRVPLHRPVRRARRAAHLRRSAAGVFWLVRRRGPPADARRPPPRTGDRGASRPARGTRMGAGHAHVLYLDADSPVHRLAARGEDRRDGGRSPSPWWPPRARRSGPSAGTPC